MSIDSSIRKYAAEREAIWHGTDAKAKARAIAVAKRIGGYVILSKPPESEPDQKTFGYWSDSTLFLRNWELVVYPGSE